MSRTHGFMCAITYMHSFNVLQRHSRIRLDGPALSCMARTHGFMCAITYMHSFNVLQRHSRIRLDAIRKSRPDVKFNPLVALPDICIPLRDADAPAQDPQRSDFISISSTLVWCDCRQAEIEVPSAATGHRETVWRVRSFMLFQIRKSTKKRTLIAFWRPCRLLVPLTPLSSAGNA